MAANSTETLAIARRYATAIFSLAAEANKAEAVVAEMGVLAAAIENNTELAQTLANPVVLVSQKTAVLAALVAKADALTQRAVNTIAEGNRASVIPQIATELRARLAAHNDEVEAIITSARALPAATQKKLGQSIAQATGKAVRLTLRQDKAVLGGVSIQVGSLKLDATLAGALNQMREQLLAPTN